MRELHVVATSEDGRHVLLATRKGAASGDFRVALDDRLAAAVRGDLPRPGETQPAVVTPKEIQARLRAGESPEQIAASAGVPVAKIDRYAGPVLSERERVITQARAGFVSRSRLGASALPLGEAVDRHLALTSGVRPETVAWSARREDSGSWLVELSYVSQARRRSAAWRYDGARREVTALDPASAALAHVEPGRRTKAAEPEPLHVAPSRPAARTAARRAAPVRVAKAPGTRTVAARPAPPVRAAAPVPHASAPVQAAQRAADRAAAAKAAHAETVRAAAQERAAQAAAVQAARAAEAEQVAARKARAAEARAAKQAAERAAKAEAARLAKAEAAREAAEEATRKAEAAQRAEAARQAKAEAARTAKAEKAAKAEAAKAEAAKAEAAKAEAAKAEAAKAEAAKAEAAKAEAAKAEAAKAEAAKAEAAKAEAAKAEAARVAQEDGAPSGPPTLRVVGADEAAAPARRGPKQPPAAARTAPARAAGQRASVPGWADVLLSTAPVARTVDPQPDED